MVSVPRSPCENSNRQNERYSDNGEPSRAAFPILAIPHAAVHVSLSNPDFKLSWRTA
jgi:hypothetical protein